MVWSRIGTSSALFSLSRSSQRGCHFSLAVMIQSSPKVHHLCFGHDGMAYTHVFKLSRPSFLHYVSSIHVLMHPTLKFLHL
ncbi:hypothetical protein LY78DRAFT_654038, partial [Colletotrichum sublineola]